MPLLNRPPRDRIVHRIVIASWVVTFYAIFEYYFPFSTFISIKSLSPAANSILYRLMTGAILLTFALMGNWDWKRFLRLPRGRNRWIASIALLTFWWSVHFQDLQRTTFHGWHLLLGMLFIFSIGFVEEMTSRFFLLSYLNRYAGIWIALIISSANFGLMHFSNFFAGAQGLQQTFLQAISAASTGFMLASVLIYTQSIWIPILVHASIDLSLGLGTSPEPATRSSGGVSGHGFSWMDWAGVFFDSLLSIFLGLIFLYSARVFRPGKRLKWIREFFGIYDDGDPRPPSRAGKRLMRAGLIE